MIHISLFGAILHYNIAYQDLRTEQDNAVPPRLCPLKTHCDRGTWADVCTCVQVCISMGSGTGRYFIYFKKPNSCACVELGIR